MNWLRFRFYFKVLLILIGLPVLAIGSVYGLDQNGFFNIEKINMSIHAKPEQLNFSKPYMDLLSQELAAYKGQSLWRFSLSQVANKLKTKRWIKDFRISRSWPSMLVVEVEPHILSYLYADQNKLAQGLVKPVTSEGEVLADVKLAQAPALAMLKGEVFLKDQAKRKRAIELLKSLPEEGRLSHKVVAEVGYDQKEGYWLSVVQSDVKIKLGEDQFAMKSARVSQVMDYLDKRDLKARVIDANLSKKVLVRLQQSP